MDQKAKSSDASWVYPKEEGRAFGLAGRRLAILLLALPLSGVFDWLVGWLVGVVLVGFSEWTIRWIKQF